MSKITPDSLWKTMIEKLFEDFMYHFFPKDAHRFDFSRGIEFLDKEFQTIIPESKTNNRRVDKLVKPST